MKNSYLIGVLLMFAMMAIATASMMHNQHDFELFEEFKLAHNKQYKDAAEHDFRFHAFRNTLRRIDQYKALHAESGSTATFGVNQFSDWTLEELEATYANPMKNVDEIYAQIPAINTETFPKGHKRQHFGFGATATPSSWDWRQQTGIVTPVKNQEQCGSCYSFSASAALESQTAIQTGQPAVSLAPQQIIDCDTTDNGCNGGFYTNAWNYISQAGGQESWTSYPYTGTAGTCNYVQSSAISSVLSSNTSFSSATNDTATLSNYLYSYGPWSVALYVQSDLYSYTGGVYRPSGCDAAINHAVTVVGFGSDSIGTYWIIKNSWGTSWGLSGYFQIGAEYCSISNYWAIPNYAAPQ